jgi:hypothetical protein
MKFVGLDVHQDNTVISVVESGEKVLGFEVATQQEALRQAIMSLKGAKQIVVEEGQLADFCKRSLEDLAHRFVICDPRRNRLISEAEDKDDPVDSYRLALLLWMGQIREVYHADCGMQKLKEAVHSYWQASQDLTRAKNRLRSQLSRRGLALRVDLYREEGYTQW